MINIWSVVWATIFVCCNTKSVPDSYCVDIKPTCQSVCEESGDGDKVFREWTCTQTEVEFIPLQDHRQSENSSKPGKFEIDVRLGFAGRNPPLVMVSNERGEWKWAEPTRRATFRSYMNLEGKKILLACPGKKNALKVNGVPETQTVETALAYENGTTQFVIGGNLYLPDDIKCGKRVQPYEYITGETCNGDGVLLKIGYAYGDNMTIDLVASCHRLSDGLTYYSRHILDGSHFPHWGNGGKRKDEAGRPWFNVFNRALFRKFPPQNYYPKKLQIQRISDVIDKDVSIGKGDKFFSRGHLTPNGDFIMLAWREATFSYVNVQPQWQEINGGNWLRIEKEIRYNAAKTAMKYEVITGVAGILKQNGANVYLDMSYQRLPVPDRFTKLVREIETNKCIAFIANNFPLKSNPGECRDVCGMYNWPELKDADEAGYVYCCTFSDFMNAFPQAAPKVDCGGGVLNNSNAGSTMKKCVGNC